MKNRFEDIDVGPRAAIERMVRKQMESENALIEECAKIAEPFSPVAADAIRTMKRKGDDK